MSDYVWVSNAMDDARIKLFVNNNVSEADAQKAIEAASLNQDGKPVPQELCPTKIWASPNAPDYERMPADNMPDLFFANSYWIVSARAADILRKFNLGSGALYPVSEGVFKEDKVTRVPGDFYTWIFGNVKSAFLPDNTAKKDPVGIAGIRWNLPLKMFDDNIAVSSNCLGGSNVWLDDKLWSAIFLSRAVGDAFISEGLQSAFHIYRARVI